MLDCAVFLYVILNKIIFRITKSKDEYPINNDDYENRKPITNTKNM